MNRIVAVLWGGAALFVGGMAVSIALGPKGDASGWIMALAFAAVAGFCAWQAWRDWNEAPPPGVVVAPANRQQSPASAADFPGAWRVPNVRLETQIDALKEAGLTLAPGRTIEELLNSWARADYESDPYNLILVMYGSEVEAEPWGRYFCNRVFNFDMECLNEAGDYARVFTDIVRITGRPQLVSQLSDDFDFDTKTAEIRYLIDGRQRVLKARVDNDWADPEAVTAFVRDIETAIADDRRFWAADNGQASVLFFLTGAEAARINALRKGILERYVAD